MRRSPWLLGALLLVSLSLLLIQTAAQNSTSIDEWTVSITAHDDSCTATVEESLTLRFKGTVTRAQRTIYKDSRYKIKNVAVTSDMTTLEIITNAADGLNHNVVWTWPNATSALTFVFSYSIEDFVHYDDDNNTIEWKVVQSAGLPTSISDFSVELNLGFAVAKSEVYSVPPVNNFTALATDTILEYVPFNFTVSSLPWSLMVTFPAPKIGSLKDCTSKVLTQKNDVVTIVLVFCIVVCLAVIAGVITGIGIIQAKPYVLKLMAQKKTPPETLLLESNSMITSPELSTTFTAVSSSSTSPQV